MTLKASRSTMVKAAAGWDGVAEEFGLVEGIISPGQRQGVAFGWFAQRAEIDKDYDAFLASMVKALASAQRTAQSIAEALRDAAKDFGATDADVADSFHTRDGRPAYP